MAESFAWSTPCLNNYSNGWCISVCFMQSGGCVTRYVSQRDSLSHFPIMKVQLNRTVSFSVALWGKEGTVFHFFNVICMALDVGLFSCIAERFTDSLLERMLNYIWEMSCFSKNCVRYCTSNMTYEFSTLIGCSSCNMSVIEIWYIPLYLIIISLKFCKCKLESFIYRKEHMKGKFDKWFDFLRQWLVVKWTW